MKSLLGIVLMIIFTACSNTVNYKVDSKTHRSTAINERVRFVVVHYTATNDSGSIRTLTGPRVSSHYLITSHSKDPIYNLLPEYKRGWHAGVSEFQGRTNINDTSIGIEIVNPGYRFEGEERRFYSYSEGQIRKVAYLLQSIVERYNLHPTTVLGHSDVSPDRKHDPGPLFPWERLFKEYNIGAWYCEDYVATITEKEFKKVSTKKFQRMLETYGYAIEVNGKWTEENIKVVRAFQMHFRPSSYTGKVDLETYAILKSLNHIYN